MIYDVRHRTIYDYNTPVSFTRCVLRMTPQSSKSQTVEAHRITAKPAPSQTFHRTGPFGESTVTLLIETPHRELLIDATSRVSVHAPPPAPAEDSPAWEVVKDGAFASLALGGTSPAAFLYPTRRIPLVAGITDYGRASFAKGRPIAEAAIDLMRRIRADFIFDTKATDVSTGPAQAFAARRGVCQDFTNVMVSALRGLGLSAAYVSGYLRTVAPAGRPRLQGADATHAWVQIWCGAEIGWIGLDPTNALVVQNDHITLAVGRDYADVAPFEGVMLASGDQAVKVEVDVIPLDELATQ